MSYIKYNEKKNSVLNMLNEIKNAIGENYIKERIETKINSLKKDRFTIAVFGHFSNGKSTFLNALMGYGEEVLKEDEVASTATITRLLYPEDLNLLNKARIIYTNNEEKIVDCYDIKEFTSRNDELNVEEDITEVVVYFDSEFLKNGVEIVDTPGFNSTHLLHTQIAKSYIKKADATIFLFAADKPGAKEELNFLNEINENMERIFFILNKIDLCNLTEGSTIEMACEKLKDKLIKVGLNMEDKPIYPISALKKKEAIRKKSEEMNVESRFDIFSEALSNYLTSDENANDRLGAPINAIMKELVNYKEELNESIKSYSKNKEEIELLIENEKKEIKILEEEIKDKSKHIDRSVKKNLRKSEREIENKLDNLYDDFNEELSTIKSKFSINLFDFEETNVSIIKNIIKIWGNEKAELGYEFSNIIGEIVDKQSEFEYIEDKIMPIIENSLKIQNIDMKKPSFNFDAIDEIDKELKVCKEEYQEIREKVSKIRKEKNEKDMAEYDFKEINSKIKRLEEERSRRIESLGEGEKVKYKKTEQKKEDREGVLGWFGNKLFGPKDVEYIKEVIDDTNYNFVKERRKELQIEYGEKIELENSKMKELKNKLVQLRSADIELDEKLEEREEIRERYLSDISKNDEKKANMQAEIIEMSKKEYKAEVRKVMEKFQDEFLGFLRNSQSYFVKILQETLEEDKKKLQRHKDRVYDMAEAKNENPDVLDKKIKEMYIKLDKNNSYLDKLRDTKECI